MTEATVAEYDRRLFGDDLRGRLHMARFHWLARATRGMQGAVVELGCGSGRALEHFSFQPTRYLGLDAMPDAIAQARLKHSGHEFICSRSPDDIVGSFDLAIALETLEHVDRDQVPAYLDRLSKAAPRLLVSVPVEVGPIFALKHLAKRVLHGEKSVYTPTQFMNQTLGRSHLNPQHEHLGFDYRWLVREVEKRFIIEKKEALPFGLPGLCMQVALTARSKA